LASQAPIQFTAGKFRERIYYIFTFFFSVLEAALDGDSKLIVNELLINTTERLFEKFLKDLRKLIKKSLQMLLNNE
jgi:hypothetical protein